MLYAVAPVATLAALRAFGELLAKRAAAKMNLQMLGRATRRCDDIGKEVFRIFDAAGNFLNQLCNGQCFFEGFTCLGKFIIIYLLTRFNHQCLPSVNRLTMLAN